MSAQKPSPPQGGKPQGLPNPYAAVQRGLPNPYSAATVASAAPVKYTEEQVKAQEQKKAAPIFHNPHLIKRPQAKGAANQRPKMPSMPTMSAASASSKGSAGPASAQKGIEYWRSTAEDDAAQLESKSQRNWELKQKNKQAKKFQKQYGYWKPDTIYKAGQRTNLAAYRASGAYQRRVKNGFAAFVSEQAAAQPTLPVPSREHIQPFEEAFLLNLNLRDPEHWKERLNQVYSPTASVEQDPLISQNDSKSRSSSPAVPEDLSATYAAAPEDTSGEDAYAHRAGLSWQAAGEAPAPTPHIPALAAGPHTISAPPVRFSHAITNEEPIIDQPLKKQKLDNKPSNKIAHMMAKMGYVPGKGLGKNNDGIVSHLEVKARKTGMASRKRIPEFGDDDVRETKTQQVYEIHGGHREKKDEPSEFGQESKVVVAWGCVDGIDWDADSTHERGGIRQEMGEVFNKKFGNLDRIHVNMPTGTVYLQFSSAMSALNAVNRFAEGYRFRDRNIRAIYYDEKKFAASVYDH